MLELKGITKKYLSGENEVQALKGIDLKFRKSEFVSILGHSGCGKTTLLNIIGGLDRYTDGDLKINGKSTKEFKDKDWDAYRNYAVGFVFQNYNLIPHQTVLSNVELALTLSGVNKKERKQRAIKALEDVGLKDQIHKKPNQMSGGQMQRVAIARALVNDPDIILADEPTGALDTETSKQIMEILKKISNDKLIIMVTHNPEIAEKYSSRVIKILDGKIVGDSNPFDGNEEKEFAKSGKTSMNFFTALSLSLNNLMTKKARTFLTSFAGSIGIIGIALILSLSNGIQMYINKVEEDTLSSYPIQIEAESIDMSSILNAISGTSGEEENLKKEDGKVYTRTIMTDLLSTVSTKVKTNNLKDFKKYLEEENSEIKANSNSIEYGYGLTLNLYSNDIENGVIRVNPGNTMEILGFGESQNNYRNNSAMFTSTDVWTQLLNNKELLKTQYDLLAGRWAEKYDEVVLMIDKDGYITDYTLYTLGILSQDDLKKDYEKMISGEEVEKKEHTAYTYDDLLNLKYKLVLNTDYYEKENGIWIDKSNDENYMKKVVENADEIKVVGIIQANSENVASDSYGEIGYLIDLQNYVINKIKDSEIVKEQQEDKEKNVFTGTDFPKKDEKTTFDIGSMTKEQRAYYMSLSSEELAKIMVAYQENSESTYEGNLEKLGVVDTESPKSIYIYPKSFETKELINSEIEKYNKKMQDEGKDENVISYSDIVGTMMKSVTTIVNLIRDVLIAFVSISLIVSSIMIGIITYISVLERVKEIGILRSIGASKKDISRVFNAETFIVGLIAGILGIGITILLNIPINIIIKAISGISGISKLPVTGGITLIIISMMLTIIAGLIPSKLAAKKDPVEALRTE